MKRNHGRTNEVPLQGDQGMEIKEIFHIKASDLYYSFFFSPKYKTLILEAKRKTAKKKTVKQKTKDKNCSMQMHCIRSIYVWAEL